MNQIQTKDPKFSLRMATPEDAALVVSFMKKLGAQDYTSMVFRLMSLCAVRV